MDSMRRILVTGATGHLGKVVCAELSARGHRVRATDLRFDETKADELLLGDLRDEPFAYRAVEGCDAVVQLGNHPNPVAGPSRQALLAENTAMNANIFLAASELKVTRLVFASSIQAILGPPGGGPPPYQLPYLPVDGELPTNPGLNTYALSKEYGERLLRLLSANDPQLSVTVLRFPMLPHGAFLQRLQERKRVTLQGLNFSEALAFLALDDAARLVALSLEQARPGYHQYFPALSQELEGWTLSQLVERYYPGVPLRKSLDQLEALIDISALERDFGFRPNLRLRVKLE